MNCSQRSQAHSNNFYYIEKLTHATIIDIDFERPFVGESQEKYRPYNPSIQKYQDPNDPTVSYLMICRTVNYDYAGGQYRIMGGDHHIITRNFLLYLDNNFKVLRQQEIIDNVPRPKYNARINKGFDDCRLFSYKNQWWFTCNSLDSHPQGLPRIYLCQLEMLHTGPIINVISMKEVTGTPPQNCEKNWLPFSSNLLYNSPVEEKIGVVYSHQPLIIKNINCETGESSTLTMVKTDKNFDQFRGGGGPIRFNDGYLTIIHEVFFREKRYYVQRFVYMNKDFVIERVSLPFYFTVKQVEFCAGMCETHDGENILLTFGINDSDAKICKVSKATIKSLLK